MNQAWQNWIKENIDRGVAHARICQILDEHGFSTEHFHHILEKHSPAVSSPSDGAAVVLTSQTQQTSSTTLYTRHENRYIHKGQRIQVAEDRLEIHRIDNLFTAEECRFLTAIIKKHSQLAKVARNKPPYSKENQTVRSNASCYLDPQKHSPFISEVDERITAHIGIHKAYSESIQGQHYQIDQFFKPHLDCFTPGTEEYTYHTRLLGQRTWTCIVYLQSAVEGGETVFPKLKTPDGAMLSFAPEAGGALVWNNLYNNGELNPDALHEGKPVAQGEKTILTKWFRYKRVD